MDFGRTAKFEKVDFCLPADDPITHSTLAENVNKSDPRVHLGCPIWVKREWVGSVYPPKTKPADYLFQYGQRFNAVELNSSFYHLPAPEKIDKWLQKVGPGFRFCPKIEKRISHAPGLPLRSLTTFVETIRIFGSHLGVCFLQLSPHFDPSQKRALARFLAAFPREVPLAIELRHPAWFEDNAQRTRLFEYLRRERIGLVISDVAGRRDVLHMGVTAPFAFIRFTGHNLHPTDFSRLDVWAKRLSQWFDRGLRDVYFFMHQPNEMGCAELVNHLARRINDRLGLQLPILPLGMQETDQRQQTLW